MRRFVVPSVTVSTCVAVLSVLASRALAAEPLGPEFGNNRFLASLDTVNGRPDTDDYVAALMKGETLSIQAVAAARSDVRPVLTLLDPGGNAVDPAATSSAGGRAAKVRGFTVTRTGLWTVRVASSDGSQGGYAVRFRISSPLPTRFASRRLGGVEALAATHDFEALEGASLSFSIRAARGGARVTATSLLDPSGAEVALPDGPGDAPLELTAAADVRLAGPAGTYRLGVGIPAGEASYRLVLGVRPPPRPRGTVRLDATEPYLAFGNGPVEGSSNSAVRLPGANFPVSLPRPQVWFGDAPATVAGVGSLGDWLDVVAPPAADGAVVAVTVRNPDGQGVTRKNLFRYVPRGPLDVLRIDPGTVVLQQASSQEFTVTLTRATPPLGTEVTLTVTGGVGTAPAVVHVPGTSTTARFRLNAASEPALGSVTATLLTSVAADVRVVAHAGLASISPSNVQILEGATQTFTVLLAEPAPPSGIDVPISVSGNAGAAPAWIRVPAHAGSASFDFTAAKFRTAGTVTASSANAVAAEVAVIPPDTVDLSGWTIAQTNSPRTFTVPSGAVLREGGYLVIGRNATRTQFETFWGRTLGDGVVYLDGADQWPSINGSETFELKDAKGVTVDGPTLAMGASGGTTCQRHPGMPAGLSASWTVASASPPSNATPGGGQAASAVPAGVYVSEFSDALGSGNFVYEFVEIHFDRLP